MKYITLAQDGTGDYTTIQEVLNNITENTTVYVKDGLYQSTYLSSMSKTGIHIEWIGEGINTIVEIQRSGNYNYNFTGTANFRKMQIRPVNNFGDDWFNTTNVRSQLCYVTDTYNVNFHNILFNHSLNGIHPINFWFSFNNKDTNKSFYNCTFNQKISGNVYETPSALIYDGNGVISNCIYNADIDTVVYDQNSNTTVTNTIKAEIDDTTYKAVGIDNSVYGIYGGNDPIIDETETVQQGPSPRIKNSVLETILNHEMIKYITIQE